MKVHELMTSQPLTCGPESNLAEVAQQMWNGDCGIVPIIDTTGKLLGVVTDRDICIAAATQNTAPSRLGTSDIPHGDVFACRPDDDAQVALTMMRERRIRRVPVTSGEGMLVGILSLGDVALAASNTSGISAADVLNALQSICAHRPPLSKTEKAEKTERPAAAAKAAGASLP